MFSENWRLYLARTHQKRIALWQCFKRFCEIGTVENWERSARPSKITEEKIDKVHHVTENQQRISVQTVATICSIFRATAYRIMTEYLSLTPYKAQFVQKLDEEDF